MADDERDVEAALRAAKALLAEREAEEAELQSRLGHARRVMEELSRHRKRGRVDMLDSAQRGAVRTLLLAVGSATLIAGARRVARWRGHRGVLRGAGLRGGAMSALRDELEQVQVQLGLLDPEVTRRQLSLLAEQLEREAQTWEQRLAGC